MPIEVRRLDASHVEEFMALRREALAAHPAAFGASLESDRGLDGVQQVQLEVSGPSREARALYERAGFVAWGTEPAAMIVDGEAVDQDHMILELGEGER